MYSEQIKWKVIYSIAYAALVFLAGLVLYGLGRLPQKITLMDLGLVSFATFRLIRLFVYDYIFEFIREYFERFLTGYRRTLADLLECPWCAGVWMALAVSFFFFLSSVFWFPVFILAISGIATYLQLIIIRIGYKL